MATIKFRVVIEMQEQKRRRKDLNFGFVAISPESKIVLCLAPTKLDQIIKDSFFVMRGCKSFPVDMRIYVEVLNNTKANIPYYVKQRRLRMSHTENLDAFRALVSLASNDSSHQMEMLCLSPHVCAMLRWDQFSDRNTQRVSADLFVIELNKKLHVSAVAPSYRQPSSRKRT